MSRSLELTAESPHVVERIRAAFDDRQYWAARLEFVEGGSPTLDALSTDADGTTTMQMSMRFGGDQLPGPLQKLRLGSLHVVQREHWYALDDGRVRGEIDVDAVRTPISGRGSVRLLPQPAGTSLTGTASIDVKVPFIGGAIGGFLAGLLANGILDIVRVTDTWLAGNP